MTSLYPLPLKKSFFTTALLLLVFTGYAQRGPNAPVGTIKGTVKTQDGQPAPYVNLYIKENTNKGATTSDDGSFTIKGVKEGSYTLVTSFVGYSPEEKTVEVVAGQTAYVDFQLAESSEQLSEVVITDSRSVNEKTTTIGKADIKAMDLPQSVMVIDRSVLERQQSLRLSDVLMNTNGVYVMGASGGTQEEIAGRGFAFGSNNTFKNGIRFNNGVMPEVSSVERVEVLKGSNAILFGNVAAGGVLNLVTKKPKFERGGEISMRAGSYDFYKPAFDIYGAIGNSEKVAYRVNSSYENARSFRDGVTSERIYFNPSLLIKAGRKTEVLVEGDYLKDNRTLDYGIGAIDYAIVDLPRSRFLGASWSYYKAEQKSATITVSHELTKNWKLRATTAYQGYDNDQYGTTRPNASGNAVKADGTWVRGLQRAGVDQQYYLGQIDATGKFKTGSVEHAVLIGTDIDRYDNTTPTYAYVNPVNKKNTYDTINIFNLDEREQRQDIPSINRTARTKNPIDRVGFYVQDLVSLTAKLKVLAGIRYSYIESESNVLTYATSTEVSTTYYDDAFTPRFGIVYQPIKEVSIFTSYANSFTLNTAKGIDGNILPPSFLDQYEAGVKSELLNGLLSANLTVYQIVNSNLVVPVPDQAGVSQVSGEVTSKGVEVDVMSKPINGFSFVAGYSYNDTRYTKSDFYVEGSRLRYNPSHTGNASAYYTFANGALKGLNVGVIGFYMGERVAGRSTSIANPGYKLMPVPSFFQFDASAGYAFDNISVRLKVSNLLNELSYHAHDDNSVNPIAPRMFSATVAYKW
jgi:iron complex outermembrane receptor protein